MSSAPAPSYETARMVRDSCLCLHIQRASRAIGRRFDDAFRPLGLTNFQFSLLMMLNRPAPLTIGELADCLAMDRTTITANLKPLQRRGLLISRGDRQDARIKQIVLTRPGRSVLARAVNIWQATNDTAKASIDSRDLSALYSSLAIIAEARP